MENYGSFNLNLSKSERGERYKVAFLNSVFLLAGIVAFGMGFIRWQTSVAMGEIDFGFAGLCFVLLAYLRRHRSQADMFASIVLVLCYGLFLSIYISASYNTMRLSLFFLLAAAAFFLKGRIAGRIWLAFILLTIVIVHVLPYFETGYSHIDIFTTCLYLLALFIIFENYETFKESQHTSEEEQALLRLTEERWRHALEGTGDAVWDWRPETGEFHYSRRFSEMLGYAEGELGKHAEHIFNIIHPDDEPRVRDELHDFIQRRAGNYVSEMRLSARDGSWKWMLCRGKVAQRDDEHSAGLMVGTFSDITLLKQHERQLEHIAHYDALTGIPNRVLLADRLQQALAHSKREGTILAVCYLDLDGFKLVNDTMGHEAGDKVLIEVTQRIKKSIRGDDTVARLGGDEFAVLLLGLHAPEECSASLNRLLEEISQPIEIKNRLFEVSASIGVSIYPGDDHDADTLLRHADQAMYTAKQSGKNRYYLYDTENDQRARSHHEFLRRLALALGRNEFELYYQPKVDMRTLQLVGAEALIRWHHPERGLLAPGDFLHAIEGTTLEVELGDWVVATALAQLEAWHEAGLPMELSINISVRHLQANDFAWKLKRKMLRYSHLPKGCLQVEVLETAALEDIPRVSDTIERCRKIGISFALDDFGTGYSSLSYLGRLPVDALKIDQSFIRDMLKDKGDRAIVQGVIALAKVFNRKIVAEGVESEELFRDLVEMGCEYGQGYGIARPMPASELPAWLEKWNSKPFS
ncbi:putative bifunctional diguanylate cyclase/phosphodiesterase [Sideroxydans lithotrophicus]|uniref:Diguanylate cyclase/phosphodiesterase with PAS/PAC sensor(S) n=1 Tax=Sideroxydans lithotrophicus (strain ES-1) TaxID=580332 RepID=D5CMA5_SIDLE|nr:GGDEF domain-containing phosphodiesterase [Sideroxydans lithotrophicus]ADE10719.1 diguanylate cyclase/phosphodiesterase with PAS/PAC sensor(s) [Sideroxydans lithotrophicus ES-1]